MLYSLLGSKKIVQNNLKLMSDSDVGMLGSMKISVNRAAKVNMKSFKFIEEYLDTLNIKITDNMGYFIPGTIFWTKGEIFDYYFNKKMLLSWYSEFKPFYCGSLKNNTEGKPHAFERLFGILTHCYGKKVVSFNVRNI